MATTYSVLLVGGPCNGQTKQLSDSQLRTGRTYCGGKLYLTDSSKATISHPWVFVLSTDLHPSSSAPNPRHVTQAWSRWMHALAHRGPESHRRTLKVAARARRIARNR